VLTWYVILHFCATAPCTARYYPDPMASPYECARFAMALRHEWHADGATCAPRVPAGAIVLPGRIPPGRWA